MGDPKQTAPRQRLTVAARAWPLSLVAAVLLLLYASGGSEYLSLDAVIREHEALSRFVDAHAFGAAAAYLAAYTAAIAVSFPGASFLTILGGFLFGAVLGTALTVVAATAGATVIFVLAKTSLGETLRQRAGRFTQRLAEGFEDNAFSYLLSLRLMPIFPFWLINVAPALFNVRVATYVAATALGIIPGTFAYSLIGSGLEDLIAQQEAANPGCAAEGTCAIDPSALVSTELVVGLVALSIAALAPAVWKRLRRRRKAAGAA